MVSDKKLAKNIRRKDSCKFVYLLAKQHRTSFNLTSFFWAKWDFIVILNQDFLEKHLNEKWVKRSRCKILREIERWCWLCRILVWMVDGIIIILVEQESRTTCWVSDDEDEDENDDHLDTQKVSRKVGKWRRRSEEASNATHLHVLRGHFITSCPASSFDLSYIQILHLSKSNSWHKGKNALV